MISPSKVHARFWVPVWSDPKLAADAQALALKIAGEGAPAQILALARDVAEHKSTCGECVKSAMRCRGICPTRSLS
jgi:hypothetical protein